MSVVIVEHCSKLRTENYFAALSARRCIITEKVRDDWTSQFIACVCTAENGTPTSKLLHPNSVVPTAKLPPTIVITAEEHIFQADVVINTAVFAGDSA